MSNKRNQRHEEIERTLEELQRSGLSTVDFAKKHRLRPQLIYNWRSRRRKSQADESTPCFNPIAVTVVPSSCDTSADLVKLHLRPGCFLEFPVGTHANFLAQVIRELI